MGDVCPPGRIYEPNEGTVFEAHFVDAQGAVFDISTATELKIRFIKPDGTVLEVMASFITDGTDGGMSASAPPGYFVASAGIHRWQPFVNLPTWQGYGLEQVFSVYALPI